MVKGQERLGERMNVRALRQHQRSGDDHFVSFDDFSEADLLRLREMCADNDVNLQDLRTIFDHPRAGEAVTRTIRQQRPLARFASFVDEASAYRQLMQSIQREERFRAKLLPEPSEGRLERERCLRALSARLFIHETHERTLALQAGNGSLDIALLALLSLQNERVTFDAYERAARDRFGPASYIANARSERDRRNDLLASVMHSIATPQRARLVYFGLLEVEEWRPTLRSFQAKLPPGASFAGYELFAALQRYPRLVEWMRLHPAGGVREQVTQFGLWLPGYSICKEGQEYALRLDVVIDGLERPVLGRLQLVALHAHRGAVDFVPYYLPVKEELLEK